MRGAKDTRVSSPEQRFYPPSPFLLTEAEWSLIARIADPRRLLAIAYFWSKVDNTGGPDACWLWVAGSSRRGYGVISWRGRTMPASRIAYEMAFGTIPPGLYVCHNCPDGDNPACVNPAHLFLGTHLQNERDKDAKGRRPKGEACVRAKLSEADVIEMRKARAAGALCGDLAVRYGIKRGTVGEICNHRSWTHIP
jgi:hypothetical protein